MKDYILAHDLGTSGNKAALYSVDGALLESTLYEYPTHYPRDGWVEQDPADWWKAVCYSTKELLEKTGISASQVACISFSAQMMGCLLVDKDGNALRNMLIWADTRSSKQEKEMIEKVGAQVGYEITGHRLSASYSAAKLLWIRDNEPEVYQRAYKMLHVKDYIIHKLTGKFVTDYSDASGTNLLDISKRQWSDSILSALDIHKDLLPELLPSATICGHLTKSAAMSTNLIEGIPVVVGGGDGSCACVGAGVIGEGKAYNILGSSSWISAATQTPLFDKERRIFNWVHLDEKLITPCGTMQAAAYSYSWYKDLLCKEEQRLALKEGCSVYDYINHEVEKSPPGANGLLYLPYVLGERSPRWNHKARGAFIGLSATTSKADLSRCVLEGVSLNLKIILDLLEQQLSIDNMIMIGGGAKGKVWLQILADIFQKDLLIPKYLDEATSIGAAVCGGVAIGAFKDYSAISKFNEVTQVIKPNPSNKEVYEKLSLAFESSYQGLLETYELLAELS